MGHFGLIVAVSCLLNWLSTGWLNAQNKQKCVILCTPALKLEPTVTFSNLFGGPLVAKLEDGQPAEAMRAEREAEFEIILALDIPTEIPRVGLTIEAIWTPFAETDRNVFSGTAAETPGETNIRDNPVELEFEFNFYLLKAEQTGEWLEIHFDIIDQFSPAQRPRDKGLYTHKLNFELDTALALFNWLPKRNWLRNLELEWSLDYLATGIPKAGDLIRDKELYLTNASPWSLSMVVVVPIAPLSP